MRKKKLWAKLTAAGLSAALIVGLVPTGAFAVTSSQVAADGTYSASQKTENGDEEFTDYEVTVSLTVEDGEFSAVTVTTGDDYDEEDNGTYFNYAVNSRTKNNGTHYPGVVEALVGAAATADTIEGWDSVSGATYTSEAIKTAALAALATAEEAEETDSGYTITIPEGLSDGVYQASGIYVEHDDDEAFTNYPISVAVTVADGAVESFTVSGASSSDTQYSKRAEEGINEQIDGKTAGTYDVDVVSTATCSSIAIFEAVNTALKNEPVETSMSLGEAIYDPDGTTFTVTITNPVSGTDYSEIGLAYAVGKFSASLTLDEDYTVSLASENEDEIVYEVTVLNETYNVDDTDYDHDDMTYNSIGQALDVTVGDTTVGRVTITSGAIVTLEYNTLSLTGGNGETLADYLDSAAELTLSYTNESGEEVSDTYTLQWAHDVEPEYTASDIFNEDGSVNFDCGIFEGSADGIYTVSISNTGYNDVTGAVERMVYVTMNVPYTDFYAAYDLTDAAVWEVEEGLDAVSTATTSKFKGTTGLANGTYNDGTYILGVTIDVAVYASDYETLDADLTENDNYYYVDLDEEPDAYSILVIDDEGEYSFTKYQDADVSTEYLYVDGYTLIGGYGDYQISLMGVGTDKTIQIGESDTISYGAIYGAILTTTDGGSYGMTALENLWFGTKVDDVEIAWSIVEGQGLCRAHGSGDPYYQFENMNGATLSSVILITDLGIITIDCNQQLDEYYDGDLSELSASIANNSLDMAISGIPSEFEDVTVTVDELTDTEKEVSSEITTAAEQTTVSGTVALDSYPEDGIQYTVTISSSNYPDVTTTVSTPISALQIAELEKWIALAEAADGYDSNSDLQEHVAEAEELIASADAASYDAATLIDELISKVKATYTETVTVEDASLQGSVLEITLSGADYADLENPTYTLTYSSGRNTATLTSGSLTGLKILLDTAPTVGTSYTLTIVSDNYVDITASVTAEAAESTTYKYVTMNVPYADFYAVYGLTDAAVWEVETGIDAVSTATTSKFKGTTGLANGTYNDGTYILGVTLAVAVSETDYTKLSANLTENDNYYFVDLTEEPTIYSTLLIDSEGNYSFSKYQTSTVSTDELSVDEYTMTGGYGDYQISLTGVGTDKTLAADNSTVAYNAIYGAILTTTDGGSYGMTALENLWFGTKVDNVEIAWSIVEGQGLCRAHGSGDPYYQFENMNGETLNSVILITDLGLITISCMQQLDEYYDGDLSELSASIASNSLVMQLSGIPDELEDVRVTVDGLTNEEKEVDTNVITVAAQGTTVSGTVTLDSYPEDGVLYTVTISSSNYPSITTTASTPIITEQIAELQKWINAAKELSAYATDQDLQEHAEEAEALIANADATSYEAAVLIEELMGKVKAYYPTETASATLEGVYLTVTLDTIELTDLTNPTYTLTYRSGRNTVTLTSGDLDSLRKRLQVTPTVGTEYTLTIVSDNYQDITATVTAAEATVDTSALETAIASAEALTESAYTADSWAALTSALTAAKEALEAGESQTAIDTATANLNAAISALEAAKDVVDTSALTAAIAAAEALTQSDYTADSWTALQTALAAAKAALTAAESQSAVDQAVQVLNTAIDGLVKATTSTTTTTSDTSSDNSSTVSGTVTSDDSSSDGSSSDSSSSSASTSSAASTGDNTNLWIWMLVILIAAASAGVTVKRRKEQR